MKTEQTNEQVTKPVKTLRELSDRVELRFDQLRTLIIWLGKRQIRHQVQAPLDKTDDGGAPLQQLTRALRAAADAFVTVCSSTSGPSPADQTLAQDLARALALTGNGERFELSVESVIRNYCEARQDVFRYTHHPRLEDSLRQDVVAGFARVVEGHRLELQLLGVQIDEVQPGTSFDSSVQEVIKRVPCGTEHETDTVRHCVTPVFRWTTGAGIPRIKPARVIMNGDRMAKLPGSRSPHAAMEKDGRGRPQVGTGSRPAS